MSTWHWGLAALFFIVVGTYWFLRAMNHLAPMHPDSELRIYFVSKVFSRRANFTARGWRFILLARISLVLVVACFFAAIYYRSR